MPDIWYVCLSDMHLGDRDSLLTHLKNGDLETDPEHPSPVLERLVGCLRYLVEKNEMGKKPTLILNGDILELAVTTDNRAAMAFERFIELIMPKGGELFERIFYIPGNHDHHLWESARETQYANFIKREIEPHEPIPIPWHATNMFVEHDLHPVSSLFLTNLVQRYEHLKEFSIPVAYPNFGLVNEGRRECVIFHHGHFVEKVYRLMSIVKDLIFPQGAKPIHVWNLEEENFAWIDFFWSTMGRSGEAGKGIETIFERIQDKQQFKKLLYTLADTLAQKYDLPGWEDWMEAAILKALFRYLLKNVGLLERSRSEDLLSQDAKEGLESYINGPLKEQFMMDPKMKREPSEVTLVFGHTHKPFEGKMVSGEYPEGVRIYNSGGWVVDNVDRQPRHGGAMILIDEKLEATSLRMYNENKDANQYTVKVQQARPPGDSPGVFHARIEGLLNGSPSLWRSFSEAVAQGVKVRARNLRARIQNPNHSSGSILYFNR